jgi:hypothetical protein
MTEREILGKETERAFTVHLGLAPAIPQALGVQLAHHQGSCAGDPTRTGRRAECAGAYHGQRADGVPGSQLLGLELAGVAPSANARRLRLP